MLTLDKAQKRILVGPVSPAISTLFFYSDKMNTVREWITKVLVKQKVRKKTLSLG